MDKNYNNYGQEKSKQQEFDHLQQTNGDQTNDYQKSIEIQISNQNNQDGAEKSGEIDIDPSIQKNLQKNFIIKTLSILFIMWAISILVIGIIVVNENLSEFVSENSWLFYICLAGLIIQALVLYCFRQTAKRVPYNYVLLFGFTFCMSYTLGYMCASISETALLISVGLTTAVVLFLSIYAWKSEKDITYKVCMMGYGPMAIFLLILCLLTFKDKITEVLVSLLIVGVFGVFLVFDLQRLKGKFFISYKIDDYIIAALDIYLDIVLIFKYLTSAISN